MELTGDKLIPASIAKTWAALNDPEVLKGCVAGCETLERTGDDAFTAVVALKVGPVSARFKGNLKMTNIDAPNGYTINFDGQGGVAGFGKGSADVALTAESPTQTRLQYNARAQVGGKMAQVGSRLIDAAAGKITDDFFKAFEARLQATSDAEAAEASAATTAATTAPKPPTTATAAAAPTVAAAAGAAPVRATVAAVTAPASAPASGDKKLWWLIGAVIVAAVVYFAIR